MSSLDYNNCEKIFFELNVDYSVSFSHGILCGFFCIRDNVDIELWLREILTSFDDKDVNEDMCLIFNNTKEQITDPTLNFQILIEDDSQPLSQQAISLVDWCQGFLLGIGLSDMQSQDQELMEAIKDISEISKLNIQIADNNENTEQLTQIIEFVRMNVLLIQEIAKPSKHDYIDTQVLQ